MPQPRKIHPKQSERASREGLEAGMIELQVIHEATHSSEAHKVDAISQQTHVTPPISARDAASITLPDSRPPSPKLTLVSSLTQIPILSAKRDGSLPTEPEKTPYARHIPAPSIAPAKRRSPSPYLTYHERDEFSTESVAGPAAAASADSHVPSTQDIRRYMRSLYTMKGDSAETAEIFSLFKRAVSNGIRRSHEYDANRKQTNEAEVLLDKALGEGASMHDTVQFATTLPTRSKFTEFTITLGNAILANIPTISALTHYGIARATSIVFDQIPTATSSYSITDSQIQPREQTQLPTPSISPIAFNAAKSYPQSSSFTPTASSLPQPEHDLQYYLNLYNPAYIKWTLPFAAGAVIIESSWHGYASWIFRHHSNELADSIIRLEEDVQNLIAKEWDSLNCDMTEEQIEALARHLLQEDHFSFSHTHNHVASTSRNIGTGINFISFPASAANLLRKFGAFSVPAQFAFTITGVNELSNIVGKVISSFSAFRSKDQVIEAIDASLCTDTSEISQTIPQSLTNALSVLERAYYIQNSIKYDSYPQIPQPSTGFIDGLRYLAQGYKYSAQTLAHSVLGIGKHDESHSPGDRHSHEDIEAPTSSGEDRVDDRESHSSHDSHQNQSTLQFIRSKFSLTSQVITSAVYGSRLSATSHRTHESIKDKDIVQTPLYKAESATTTPFSPMSAGSEAPILSPITLDSCLSPTTDIPGTGGPNFGTMPVAHDRAPNPSISNGFGQRFLKYVRGR